MSSYEELAFSTASPFLAAPPTSCSRCSPLIGPGGLAAEAPGEQTEGGVRRRRHGVEEEAVGQLCSGTAEEPSLEAAVRSGEPTSASMLPGLSPPPGAAVGPPCFGVGGSRK